MTGSSLLKKITFHLQAGKVEKAIELCDALVEGSFGHAEAEELLIVAREFARKKSKSLKKVLQKLGRLSSKSAAAWVLHLSALLELENKPRIFNICGNRPPFPRRWVWALTIAAEIELRQRIRPKKAVPFFQKALKAMPSHWKARASLAEAKLVLGDPAGAEREFAKAIAPLKGPPRAEALGWRGALRLWRGDFPKALLDLNKAARAEVPFAFGWRGAVHAARGELSHAQADLDRELERFPRDQESLVWRGEVARKLGKMDRALKFLEQDGFSEDNPWAGINRALVFETQGKRSSFRKEINSLPGPFRGGGNPRRLEAILNRAGGLRRHDDYLLPLAFGGRKIRFRRAL